MTCGNTKMWVFHYTTKDAIKSILASHELWFTRSDCFEDKSEFTFFEDIVKKAVCKYYGNREDVPWALLRYFPGSVSRDRETDHVLFSPDVLRFTDNKGFVLSASGNSGNEYLWDKYCDHGSDKIALILDAGALAACIKLLEGKGIEVRVEPVLYGEAAAMKRIEEIIAESELHYYQLFDSDPSALSEIAAEDLNYNLEYMINATKPFIKRCVYEEEEEVRLLLSLPDEEEFSAEARNGEASLGVFRDRDNRWRASLALSNEWFLKVVVGICLNNGRDVRECRLSDIDLNA